MLRRMRRPIYAAFCLSAALSCARPAPQPLDYVPADALLVGEVDVAALARTGLARRLLAAAGDDATRALPDTCGHDVLVRTTSVVVVVPRGRGDLRAGDLGLVARGDLDERALLSCAKRRARDRGSSIGETTVAGVRLYFDPDRPGGALAFPSPGVVLGGTKAALREMIETGAGKRPRMPRGAEHFKLRDRLGTSHAWAALRIPEQTRAAMLKDADELLRPFLAVSWFAAGVRLGDAVHAAVVVRGADEPSARRIEALGERLLARARDDPAFAGTVVDHALDQVVLAREGSEVTVSVEVPKVDVDAVVKALLQ